jgi:hypothetical protein
VTGYRITADGFRSVLAACMTGEAGEHMTEIREGSLLQLADSVARRCIALCQERDVEMNNDIYDEVVAELAPHFAQRHGD